MTADFFDRTLPEWTGYIILLAGFISVLIVQITFYFRLLFVKKSEDVEDEKPISVLLCVRNEESRIEHVINQLIQQDYKKFEVVIVDDFSEDSTLTIIGVLAKKYPNVRFSSLAQETIYSEKISINLALKAAKYDHVIFVDPSTSELDPSYLKKINNRISSEGNIVIAYSNSIRKKGFYNWLCRVDRLKSFMTSAAYSSCRIPLFYAQENVLFPKDEYFKVDGFRGKMNKHYANLELLLNQVRKRKIVVSVDPEAQVKYDNDFSKSDYLELVRKRLLLFQKLKFGKKLALSLGEISGLLILIGFCWLLINRST